MHVPYRGGALAVTDLMAGQVQMMIDVMPNALPLARDGRARGIAVSTATRYPGAPEFPTIDESGLPGFEASAWDGIFVPAGTPAPIVTRLNEALRAAVEAPDVRQWAEGLGTDIVTQPQPEFQAFFLREVERWGRIVARAGVRVE